MSSHPSPSPQSASSTPEKGEDSTLGGYFETHDRPPAFEGTDGHPYSVSIEVERTPDLARPYHAYLVFPRWARTGVGIVGHVETDTLYRAASEQEARAALGGLDLMQVRELLDTAVLARTRDGAPPPPMVAAEE